jgi:hypothetical protein
MNKTPYSTQDIVSVAAATTEVMGSRVRATIEAMERATRERDEALETLKALQGDNDALTTDNNRLVARVERLEDFARLVLDAATVDKYGAISLPTNEALMVLLDAARAALPGASEVESE